MLPCGHGVDVVESPVTICFLECDSNSWNRIFYPDAASAKPGEELQPVLRFENWYLPVNTPSDPQLWCGIHLGLELDTYDPLRPLLTQAYPRRHIDAPDIRHTLVSGSCVAVNTVTLHAV
jgi:hypothetical protein